MDLIMSNSAIQSSESADDTLTALDLLEKERELEESAAEIFAYKTDKCSFDQGYVTQQVYACLTCNPPDSEPAGICYACQIMCHADHNVIELFVKRNFRCDCGTSRVPATRASQRANANCTLQKKARDAVNEQNVYNHNFSQRYCICDEIYDPDTEEGVMYQCLACQDWFHDRCITGTQPLPNPERFSEMFCKNCCKAHPLLRRIAALSVESKLNAEVVKDIVNEAIVDVETNNEASTTSSEANKRLHVEDPSNVQPKRARVELCLSSGSERVGTESDGEEKAQFIFLAEGWRGDLCKCASCQKLVESLRMQYILREDVVYTPEVDADANKSLFESGVDMLHRVDRVKAIEGIQAMNTLSSKIKDYLKSFAENKNVVTEQDVRIFFDSLKTSK